MKCVVSSDIAEVYPKLMRSQMVRALVDITNTGSPAAMRSSTEVCGAVLRPSSLSEGGPDHEDNLLAEARDPLVKQPNILPRPATEEERGAKEESINTDVKLLPHNVSLNSSSRTQCSVTSVSVGAMYGETDECVWCIEERPGPVFPDVMPHKMSLGVVFLSNLVHEKYPKYPRVPRMFSRSKEVQGGVSLVGL